MQKQRRDFLKKACLSGACFCGFTAMVSASNNPENESDSNVLLMQAWISTLMQSIAENDDEAQSQRIMKKCATAHYKHLNMDEFLKPYEGKLELFIQFIEKEWGWKIDYNKDDGVLVADENKNFCVCPLVNKKNGVKSSILCYCSEGFAEKMFSKVIGKTVKAKVVSSIHLGDKTCMYKILI
jgi:predicted hydrocarbon binding protein